MAHVREKTDEMEVERQDVARDVSEAQVNGDAATRAKAQRREATPAGRSLKERSGTLEGGTAPDRRGWVSWNPGARRAPGSDMRLRADTRRDLRILASVLAGLTVMVIPLSLYAWQRTQPRRDLERRARAGRTREALARLQV